MRKENMRDEESSKTMAKGDDEEDDALWVAAD